jgi:hypothetical protein
MNGQHLRRARIHSIVGNSSSAGTARIDWMVAARQRLMARMGNNDNAARFGAGRR